MQKLGFMTIDALDPSKGMLEKAVEKGVYRKCIYAAIGSEPLDIPSDTYDVITAAGVFAPKHLNGKALNEIIRLVKPGGFVCIVTRMEFLTKAQEFREPFFHLCDELEKSGKWKKIECSSCSYLKHAEGVKMLYKIF